MSSSNLNVIYNTVVLPHFDYADIVWQSTNMTLLEQLQKLQNRASRIILGINPYEHKSISELHNLLDWEKLGKRRKRHMLSFMYKIMHDLAPEYMKENFVTKENKYNFRTAGLLALPKPRTNNCKRTFLYRAIVLYNELPLRIRQSGTLKEFNRQINEYLVFV